MLPSMARSFSRGNVYIFVNMSSARSLRNSAWLFSDDEKKRPRVKTPIGKLDQKLVEEESTNDVYAPFPEGKNPATGEIGGPRGPEPTRYGDWERKGRVSDF